MSERDYAVRELAALLEADLKASGAKTVGEAQAVINEALWSLMSPPHLEVVELSEADKRDRKMTVRLIGPKLPG
ncbi:hypothetical protein ABC766_00440 [Methylobacterium fujisawaense]|jgi:hypothetical protein|uniref:hypothetical protein n=1 Tax=Methylobacterium fujisawaense TaxID=107400 RepID=UPI0031F497B0